MKSTDPRDSDSWRFLFGFLERKEDKRTVDDRGKEIVVDCPDPVMWNVRKGC